MSSLQPSHPRTEVQMEQGPASPPVLSPSTRTQAHMHVRIPPGHPHRGALTSVLCPRSLPWQVA